MEKEEKRNLSKFKIAYVEFKYRWNFFISFTFILFIFGIPVLYFLTESYINS